MNLLDSLWSFVLAGSVRIGTVIAALLLVRWLCRGRMPAQCFHVLWLLVALWLLAPVTPPASWSAWFWLPRDTVATASVPADWTVRMATAVAPMLTVAPESQPEPATPRRRATIGSFLAGLWLAGVIFQGAMLTWSAWRMRQLLRNGTAPTDERLHRLAGECAAAMRWGNPLRIVEVKSVRGPGVVGLWRPRLLLPRGFAAQLSDEELRFVLLHECAHLRRRDLAMLWIITAARVVHWFNPLVWWAARMARVDAELACDETVLRQAQWVSPVSYGKALLKLAQSIAWRPAVLPAAGVVEGRRAMQVRLANLARYTPRGAWRSVVIVLIIGVAGVTLSADPPPPGNATAPGLVEAVAGEPIADLPGWASGWNVVWVSLDRDGGTQEAEVDFQRADGDAVTLKVGGSTPDGIQLREIVLGHPTALVGRVTVVLGKGEETASLIAARDVVSQHGITRKHQAQIEVETRFIELTETSARRLKATTAGVKVLDPAARDLLASRASAPQMLTGTQQQDVMQLVQSLKDTDLLSAPRVTTKAGQRAVIEIIREFRYPVEWDAAPSLPGGWNPKSFETRNCGVTIEVEPTINDAGAIHLNLVPQVVELVGFCEVEGKGRFPTPRARAKKLFDTFQAGGDYKSVVPKKDGTRLRPVFSARKIESSVTVLPGDSVLFTNLPEVENEEGFPSRAKSHRLVVIVTARLIEAPRPPAKTPPELMVAPSPVGEAGEIPVGLMVPETPGFVRSPFAPDQAAVDVRGFPPGTEVKCPASGKVFRIP